MSRRRLGTSAAHAASGTAGLPASVVAPVVLAALALLTVFLLLLTLLAGGAADDDRMRGAEAVADVATRTYQEGANRGHYHWKGQEFRDFVGGTTGRWDAAFCSWCLARAGFGEGGLVGRYASVSSFLARFEHDASVGAVHGPSERDYEPEVGDLLVLWAGTEAERIEVVTGVSADSQLVTTVSGDAAGGEAGSYDRDADGYGGYVACTEREAHAVHNTYLHPHYSADAASDAA